jgi:hypothetical protein
MTGLWEFEGNILNKSALTGAVPGLVQPSPFDKLRAGSTGLDIDDLAAWSLTIRCASIYPVRCETNV